MEEFTFISPGYSTMLGQTENRLSLFTLGQKEKMKNRHGLFAQGRAAFRFTHSVEELATVEEDCWPRERPGAAPLPAVSLIWAVAALGIRGYFFMPPSVPWSQVGDHATSWPYVGDHIGFLVAWSLVV